uniref:Uncharacterized protein n=1 Tax=Entomoneis sp. TaxID=186043 RepID=A0A3G1PWD2_9STRA|nr:hypothetical protein [Entomoneis sp.]
MKIRNVVKKLFVNFSFFVNSIKIPKLLNKVNERLTRLGRKRRS